MPPLGILPPQIHQDTATNEVIDPYTEAMVFGSQFVALIILVFVIWGATTWVEKLQNWWKRRAIRARRKARDKGLVGCLKDMRYGTCSVVKRVKFAEVVKVRLMVFDKQEIVGEKERGRCVEEMECMVSGGMKRGDVKTS